MTIKNECMFWKVREHHVGTHPKTNMTMEKKQSFKDVSQSPNEIISCYFPARHVRLWEL